jgi:hypothetical protein
MSKLDYPRAREERALFNMSAGDGDEWGHTMSHLFGMATAVYAITEGRECWEDFTPGPALEARPQVHEGEWPDDEYFDGLESGEIDRDKLHKFYNLLRRYADLLRARGLDY